MALRAFLYSCLTSARVCLNTTAHVGDTHRVSSLARAGSLVLWKKNLICLNLTDKRFFQSPSKLYFERIYLSCIYDFNRLFPQ